MQNYFAFIEDNISVIGLFIGVLAAIIAIWQLYLQRVEMKRGNRINSLESLANMLRNEIGDKQDLLKMNERKIAMLKSKEDLSKGEIRNLNVNDKAKKERGKEISSLYNGLLSVNQERCKLMEGIEKNLDENVSDAIEEMRKRLVKRKEKKEWSENEHKAITESTQGGER